MKKLIRGNLLSFAAVVAVLAGCPTNSLLQSIQETVTVYEESSQTVATPTCSPSAGTYSADQGVTISDTTDGATIYYTTDGTAPTTSSTQYTAAISVAGNGTTTTVKAIAVKGSMKASDVVTATYVIDYSQVSSLSFSPSAGTYSSDQSVTISDSTGGSTIYYTTNGDDPTTSSTQYTGPLSVSGDGTTLTIKAIAAKNGMKNSTIASATYVIDYSQVSTPNFSPSAGTYSSDQSVTISSTSGSTIYYTTDGSTPTTSSTQYTGALSVSGDGTTCTIKAIAAKSGMENSTIASATYVIHYPVTTPSGLAFSSVSAGGLKASWTSTGAQSYQLYRSTVASGSYTQVYSGSATSYTESATLMPDTTYYYEIMATYAAGTSSLSTSVGVTTLDCLYVLNESSKTIQAFSMGTDGSLTLSSTLTVSYSPNGGAISPDSSYLYVGSALTTERGVFGYKIGNGGALTFVNSCSFNYPSQGIAITPNGKYLYCTTPSNGFLRAFSVNTSTGELTALSTTDYAIGSGTYPTAVAISPKDSTHLYAVLNGTGQVITYSIDSSTGALSSPSTCSAGTYPYSAAVSPNGSFLYTGGITGCTIIPFLITSGTPAIQSTSTTGGYVYGMAINSASTRLYATSGGKESRVYAYNITSGTGVLTQIDSYSSDSFPCDVALNDDNTYLYVANEDANTVTTYSINSGTGALTSVGSYATGSYPVRLIVH